VVGALGVVVLELEGFRFAIHEHLLVPLESGPLRAADDAAEARWVSRPDLDALGVSADALAVVDKALAEARTRGLTA
jgi:hypothetical protein